LTVVLRSLLLQQLKPLLAITVMKTKKQTA